MIIPSDFPIDEKTFPEGSSYGLHMICSKDLPMDFLWVNRWAHLLYVIGCLSIGVYNGATFYIEIFAERYSNSVWKKSTRFHGAASDSESVGIQRPSGLCKHKRA